MALTRSTVSTELAAARETRKSTTADRVDEPRRRAAAVRAGILGAGLMGRWHAHALQKVGGVVVAVCDIEASRSDALARGLKARTYASLGEMIANAELDVLHICSPAETHLPAAEAAIDAGIHLLVEKPLAATAEATAALFARAKDKNTLICPVHQFVFQDGAQTAKTLLPQIGRPLHFDAVIQSAGGSGRGPAELDSIACDVLPHPLSLLRWFFPDDVASLVWNARRPAAGELLVYGAGGKVGSVSIRVSMNGRPPLNAVSIVGTEGTISLDLFHGFSVLHNGGNTKFDKAARPFRAGAKIIGAAAANLAVRAMRREPAYPGLRSLIGKFYRSIQFGETIPITPDDSIEVAATRDLIIAGAKIDRAGVEAYR